MKLVFQILWPSFLCAAVGVGVIFTLVDPMELVVFGTHLHVSRLGIYSLGFLVLWAIAAAASAMTAFLGVATRSPKA